MEICFSTSIFIPKRADLKYIFMSLEVCESLAFSGSSVLCEDIYGGCMIVLP